MTNTPAKANDSVPHKPPSRLARRLLLLGWAGWLSAVFSLWLQWRLNVYQPHTWLWLPLAVAGGIASGAVLVGGLYRTVRGPGRIAALGRVIGGGLLPLLLWALLTVYMVYEPWRGGLVLHTVHSVGALAGADLMALHARVRYPHRLESERLVMYYDDQVDQPEADVAAMEKHLARMETVLGRQQHSKIVWVRGSTIGRTREANRGVAIGSTASPAGQLDSHELAHALIFQFTQPDTDPPTVLIEGWAVSQENNGLGLGTDAAFARSAILAEKKTDRCLYELTRPPWYYQPVIHAYNIGGAWVEQLLRRYGGERFLELYNTARPETFAADCQRILGQSLDELQESLWEEIYPFDGDVSAIIRAVQDDLPRGTQRERVETWTKEHFGHRPLVTNGVNISILGKTLPQLADCPEAEVAAIAQFIVPLRPSDFHGELAPNHMQVYILLNAAEEVRGYFFLSLRELADMEARRSGQ